MTEVLDPPAVETADDVSDPITHESVDHDTPPPPATPSSILDDASREFLKRRPAVQAAVASVEKAEQELSAAMVDHDKAKTALKGKEAALEAAFHLLKDAVKGEDAANKPLPLLDQAPPANTSTTKEGDSTAANDSQVEWEKKWNAFLAQSIDVLVIPEATKEALREGGVTTLQGLVKIKEAEPVKGYTSIKGIGEKKADKLDDAFERLQASFLDTHPNPTPAPAASPIASQADSQPFTEANYNFVDTFPQPVDPTPNERYDEDYHKSVINDCIENGRQLHECKAALAEGLNDAGKKLTDKTRKKQEQKISELQLNFDEGFVIYSEKFGERASKALRAFVDSKIEKQAALKGGLD